MIIKEIRKDRNFCTYIEEIENYQEAVNDMDTLWVIHHRLETHYPNGELREKAISREELKSQDLYYNRPPEELIFLTASEHTKLHNKFLIYTEEHRRKISETQKAMKGKKDYMKTPEYRKAVSDAKRKQHIITRGSTGMHWYNNGEENAFCFECPEGYVKGRLKNNVG